MSLSQRFFNVKDPVLVRSVIVLKIFNVVDPGLVRSVIVSVFFLLDRIGISHRSHCHKDIFNEDPAQLEVRLSQSFLVCSFVFLFFSFFFFFFFFLSRLFFTS